MDTAHKRNVCIYAYILYYRQEQMEKPARTKILGSRLEELDKILDKRLRNGLDTMPIRV
jgi:hypothetical protein